MANHNSSLKRIRQSQTRRVNNKYTGKTTRNAVSEFREIKDKAQALEMLPKVTCMLDKLANSHVIHKNKAANLKSSLAKHVNSLS